MKGWDQECWIRTGGLFYNVGLGFNGVRQRFNGLEASAASKSGGFLSMLVGHAREITTKQV